MEIEEAIAHAREVAEGCPAEGRRCAHQHDELADWLEELKAYRETGLTPEEVTALQASNQELKKEALPLLQAKIEYRLEILPCRTGETVWITQSYMRKHNPPIAGTVKKFEIINDGIMGVQVLIWTDLGEGKREYGFSDKCFGKVVFLSKKKAKAALKEQEG